MLNFPFWWAVLWSTLETCYINIEHIWLAIYSIFIFPIRKLCIITDYSNLIICHSTTTCLPAVSCDHYAAEFQVQITPFLWELYIHYFLQTWGNSFFGNSFFLTWIFRTANHSTNSKGIYRLWQHLHSKINNACNTFCFCSDYTYEYWQALEVVITLASQFIC